MLLEQRLWGLQWKGAEGHSVTGIAELVEVSRMTVDREHWSGVVLVVPLLCGRYWDRFEMHLHSVTVRSFGPSNILNSLGLD